MHITKTVLLSIVSFLTLCICISVFVFFFRAIENKNTHTQAVLSTLENKIAQKSNTDLLAKKIKKVNDVKQSIDDHFVDTSRINTFVDSLEALGVQGGTKLKVTDVSASESDQNNIGVKVTIDGSFANVSQTIALLENIPYHIHITGLYLSKQVVPAVLDAKGKVTTQASVEWQGKVSFVVLTS